ncbi:MAG: tyrosine-type recombinase/integrase [Clostridium sp.]|jgi:integrase|nr:tyrosine-type recombinase/integrase [Clostridium sp.]
MSNFVSGFAPAIDAMLEYRVALGLSPNTLRYALLRFDSYCAERCPDCAELTKELAFGWLNSRTDAGGVSGNDTSAIRGLAEYVTAIGKPAYILPQGFYPVKNNSTAYIFTDAELSALFGAIDRLPKSAASTEAVVAPVLFRLIYTCGLRPNEGRGLLRENVNLINGEIDVTNTKKKKDRTVVMSPDMLVLCRRYNERGLPESEYFFPRSDGECYTSAQQDKLFKKCWADANPGVPDLPNVVTYCLRHRFASARLCRWLDEGADLHNKLAYLRAYMGHKDFSETAYCLHILPENLVKSAGVDWSALGEILPEVTKWAE